MRIEMPSPWQKPQQAAPDGSCWVVLSAKFDAAIWDLADRMVKAGQIPQSTGMVKRFALAMEVALADGIASRREGLELTAALAAERAVMLAAGELRSK